MKTTTFGPHWKPSRVEEKMKNHPRHHRETGSETTLAAALKRPDFAAGSGWMAR
jgi:hypothetical protein